MKIKVDGSNWIDVPESLEKEVQKIVMQCVFGEKTKRVRNSPAHITQKPWTKVEKQKLMEYWNHRNPHITMKKVYQEIGGMMGRTWSSIASKVRDLESPVLDV